MNAEDSDLQVNLGEYKRQAPAPSKATLRWERELVFGGMTQKGYEIDFDATAEWGCMPMEALMLSIAGCFAVDMVSMFKKMRVDLESFAVGITGERNPEPPQYFNTIQMEFNLSGKGLNKLIVERAISLAKQKYCSVYHSLRPDLQLKIDYCIGDKS